MIDPKTVGKRVVARRLKLGRSRERVAYEAGLSVGAIRCLETGGNTTLRVLGLVAAALGVDASELVRK